jgi:hypothetical protein
MPSDKLTQEEIDARREAGLKRLLATPAKRHKPLAGKERPTNGGASNKPSKSGKLGSRQRLLILLNPTLQFSREFVCRCSIEYVVRLSDGNCLNGRVA